VDLTLSSGEGIVIEQRDPREVLGFPFSGVIEPQNPTETAALDMLTSEHAWTVPITKGHAMEISRKGGAYQVDGWARLAPPDTEVYNPAFDVTPASYITAIITESGVAEPDFEQSLALLCMGSGSIHEFG